MMDDGVLTHTNCNTLNMGATSNSNGARLVALQERKKAIEETLTKKEKELRELCLQEADLTGVIPSEMPLQPGESPPSIRRKVGTSYMLPESLLKYANNKDESIADLELQLQLHANMAEAALGLAHKQNLSKTLRRQHKSEYQHHKREYKTLQEKIALLKEAQLVQQQQEQTIVTDHQKQKKKRRPLDQDDGISIKSNDQFRKSEHRQSLRSLRHTLQTDNIAELYPQFHRIPSRSTEVPFDVEQCRYEDLSSSIYKLNLNGYKSYLERRENILSFQPVLNPKQPNYQHVNGSPTYQQSPIQYNHSYTAVQQTTPIPQLSPISQHSAHIPPSSPNSSDMSSLFNSKYNSSRYYQAGMNSTIFPNYTQFNNNSPSVTISRQSSPNLNTSLNKLQYSKSPVPSQQFVYKNHGTDSIYNSLQNPHQLQPHQQYEHCAGLGGCWKKKESGEIIWCNNSNTIDSSWQRDKRFGSLDRRKNRRIQKRVSPNADNKSATLASFSYMDKNKPTVMHSPQVQIRHSKDRQLVRTQSLGSVGVQALDNVWPSDDNSSCDSENRSIHERSCNPNRRPKQKEWRETSLDSPGSPTLSIVSRCQSTVPNVLAPEEKYVQRTCVPSPIMTKPPLEIPAESNPSPRIPEANIELFNNNMPKNCTVVQAGHCKPYHEETKPFEMSDFYKYSTKFKKSPSKSGSAEEKQNSEKPNVSQRNLNDQFEIKSVFHHNMQPVGFSAQSSMGLGLVESTEQNQIAMNSQDCYSQEMKMWYNHQPPREKENNNATLV